MTSPRINLLILILITLSFSCSSDDNGGNKQDKILILGVKDDNTIGDTTILLENGVETDLSSFEISGENRGSDLFVYNRDVYIAVNELESDVAKVFKNGKIVFKTEPSQNATINSIFVSGNDVYACGIALYNDVPVATLWKNGISTPLETVISNALSVYIDGNNVYVCGLIREDGDEFSHAAYWKNGVRTILNDGNYRSVAEEIVVNNNDIHIIGDGYDTYALALYWKNEEEILLNSDMQSANAESMSIEDNTIYIAGRDTEDFPVLWINGAPQFLDEINEGIATGVVAIEGDRYIMGFLRITEDRSQNIVVWKNEKEIIRLPINNIRGIIKMAIVK